jgi:DNA-binding MarR family transcriptional regulator
VVRHPEKSGRIYSPVIPAIYLYNIFITPIPDLDSLRGHLEALHISGLAQWDVLVFIHTHGTNLASAAHVASLTGYDKATVGTALDALTSAGLIQRSRNSRGVRLYRSASVSEGDSRRLALIELIKVAGDRKGRLLLVGCLRHAVTRKERRERGGLHLA